MNKGGPIVIIEDDRDDQDIFREVFESLACKNEVLFFDNGELALDYLVAPTWSRSSFSQTSTCRY